MRTGHNIVSSTARLTLWARAWPLAGLATAVVVNVVWIGLLAYGLMQLL